MPRVWLMVLLLLAPFGEDRYETRLQRAAVILEQAGYDPGCYVRELRDDVPTQRFEEALAPVKSVICTPKATNECNNLYAVAVTEYNPGGLTWIWRPEEFTSWQRGVLEKALSAAKTAFPELDGRKLSMHVFESRDYVQLEVWPVLEAPTFGPTVRVSLHKHDLSLDRVWKK